MQKKNALAIIFIGLLAVTYAEVITLDVSKNWDAVDKAEFAFVEFFAPWVCLFDSFLNSSVVTAKN
jgi:hypothetical protein